MAINLDPTQGAAASLPGRLDRHDANARQQRWMLELEQAMFSANAKKQRGALSHQQRAEAPAQQDAPGPGGAAGPAAAAAQPFGAAAAALHLAGTAGAGGRLVDAVSPGPAPAPHAASGELDMDGSAIADAGRPAGWASMPAAVHAVARVQISVTGPAAAEGTGAIAPGSLTGAAGSATPSAVPASDHASSVQAVQQTSAAAPVSMGQSAEPTLPDSGTPAPSDPESAEKSDSGAAALADAPEFEKRLMHLIVGADGVHAYIRDAELGLEQMRSVAAALAAEMAASGQALAAVTVNGQRVATALPSRLSQALKPVRKGLPE